jgi:hypothetical protein
MNPVALYAEDVITTSSLSWGDHWDVASDAGKTMFAQQSNCQIYASAGCINSLALKLNV